MDFQNISWIYAAPKSILEAPSIEGDPLLRITVLRQCSHFTNLQTGIMELLQSLLEIHKLTMKLYKSLMELHISCKIMNLHKLDKSTARGHLKSPRSLSGISLHLTFHDRIA